LSKERNDKVDEYLNSPLANPVRLTIALYLLPREGACFKTIAEALGLTPGNLRHHLNVLRKEGMIEEKYILRGRPRKYIVLTRKGACELEKVMNILKNMFENRRNTR